MMGDIVDDLKEVASRVSVDNSAINLVTLQRAIDEIERLRLVAGAVSNGTSFADMYARRSSRKTEDSSRNG